MVTVAIVDDRAADAEALARLIGELPGPALPDGRPSRPGSSFDIRTFTSADELAQALSAGYDPDLAFIDIVLAEEDENRTRRGLRPGCIHRARGQRGRRGNRRPTRRPARPPPASTPSSGSLALAPARRWST